MKKTLQISFIVIIVFISLSAAYAARYDIDYSSNKWVNPISGTMQTNTAYDYLSATYEISWGVQHTGDDLISTLNARVYAIADGVVYHIARRTGTTNNTSVIYIRHKTSDRTEFTAVYGHCKAIDSLEENDRVIAGEYIGNIVRFGNPDHLHFGINANRSIAAAGWGRLAVGSSASGAGWRDPNDFLNSETPLLYRWEGTGSIISDDTGENSCWGCDKDELRVHPGSDKKSMVTFQWQSSNRCKSLRLETDQSSHMNEVNIRVGNWSNRHTDDVFSNVTLPFVLDSANTGFSMAEGYYYTIKVGFDNIVTHETSIFARCTNEAGTNQEKAVIEDNFDYNGLISETSGGEFPKWNGNGSIISQGSQPYSCWGCNKDEARVHPADDDDILPEVYFQWQASDRCRTLTITSGSSPDNQNDSPLVEIFIKPWNLNENSCTFGDSYSPCNRTMTQLPYTIGEDNAPSNGNYKVIQVRFLNGVTSTKSVIAKCLAW